MFTHRIRTRYSETAQDKIIHHSSYVIYFEVARLEFFRNIGCDINVLEKKGILCPVTKLTLHFQKSLLSAQDIDVQVGVHSYGKVRFTLDHIVLFQGMVAAYGQTEHCFINAAFKPMPIPSELIVQLHAHILAKGNEK